MKKDGKWRIDWNSFLVTEQKQDGVVAMTLEEAFKKEEEAFVRLRQQRERLEKKWQQQQQEQQEQQEQREQQKQQEQQEQEQRQKRQEQQEQRKQEQQQQQQSRMLRKKLFRVLMVYALLGIEFDASYVEIVDGEIWNKPYSTKICINKAIHSFPTSLRDKFLDTYTFDVDMLSRTINRFYSDVNNIISVDPNTRLYSKLVTMQGELLLTDESCHRLVSSMMNNLQNIMGDAFQYCNTIVPDS